MLKIPRSVFVMIALLMVQRAGAQQPVTTLILVRHAEKDMTLSTPDPDLSPEGRERAKRLAAMFKNTYLSAVFSTPYRRTRQTVEPLAALNGLPVTDYAAGNLQEIDKIFNQHAGKTVFICGHSNTIPALVNYLIGQDRYQVFDDNDYGNIIVVSVTAPGKPGSVVWITY